jgi:hypothetical protein
MNEPTRASRARRRVTLTVKTPLAITAAAAMALTTSPARASVAVVGLVPVTITAAAKAGEPLLNNYDCYDLTVAVSPGDFWAGADIRVALPPGYQFFAADNSGGEYTPTFRTGGTGNYRTFDTTIMAPGFKGGRAVILGSSSRKQPPDSTATFPSNGSNFGWIENVNGILEPVPPNDMMLVDAT